MAGKTSDAVFVSSFAGRSKTQTDMFTLLGVPLHQSSVDPLTEEEKFPASSPATASTSGTLAKPQPEKSLSGRDANNPEVQEKRDAEILVDQHVSKAVPRRPSDTFRSLQYSRFVAEAEVYNDITIMEDVAKVRISKSYHGPSVSDPTADETPRLRSQSWPLRSREQKTSKKVDVSSLIKPETSQDSGERQTSSELVLNGMEVSKERQRSLKPSEVERSEANFEGTREGMRCLNEEPKNLLPNCSDSCKGVPDSQARNSASGLVVSAAPPPVPVPTACSEAVVPKIASIISENVSSFSEFRELRHYQREGDGCFPFCIDEAVQNIDFENLMKIGSGGFGIVYQDITRKYAIKKGKYRPKEFNVLHSLEHPNIIELLGVKLISPSTSDQCYCIMKKMSCDLEKAHAESFYYDGLVQHLLKLETYEESLIISNVKHIFKGVAKGLIHLNDKGLYHGDITARNILLCIECGCKDGNNDIFCCECTENKYYPVIADFDSVYMFGSGAPHTNMMGTMGYRAPEVCLRKEQLKLCSCCPRSDIFGVGAILGRMLCGSNGLKCITDKANLAMRKPVEVPLNSESEGVFIQLMVKKLCQLECSESLRFLIRVAARCTEVTVGERPLASELFEMLNTDTIL